MDEPFDTTTQRKVSIESGSAAETRLPDRWLPLARLTWGIVAVLTLTVFIASLPLYLAQLQITCVGVSCAAGQLTPQAARGLLNLGFSMSSYALLIVIFVVASALVWFGVATVFLLEAGLFLSYLVFPSFSQQNVFFSLFSIIVGNSIPVLIPLSFGMAILRHHLWDIDVIINRAVVYGLLTALLALVYVGCVFAFQSLSLVFKEELSHNPITVVASTLVSAALFQPLRFGIQRVIDRRFYRRKYNSARTLTAFSATLRDEVDLDQLSEQLLAVVEETMQPAHVSLWLRSPEQFGERNTRLLPRIDEEEAVVG